MVLDIPENVERWTAKRRVALVVAEQTPAAYAAACAGPDETWGACSAASGMPTTPDGLSLSV
jgi:hypothetical protein